MIVLSWLAFLLGIGGLAYAIKSSWGWFITGFGSILWVVYAIITAQAPLVITALLWATIEFRNGLITRRNEREQERLLP